MGGDLKPSYRKNIYFAEEELPMLKTFENTISKDPRLKDVGKGNNKFSSVIKMLMENYMDLQKEEDGEKNNA